MTALGELSWNYCCTNYPYCSAAPTKCVAVLFPSALLLKFSRWRQNLRSSEYCSKVAFFEVDIFRLYAIEDASELGCL